VLALEALFETYNAQIRAHHDEQKILEANLASYWITRSCSM